MQPQNANPKTLPTPFEVFHSDPDLDRIERVAKVEARMREFYGEWHVPVRTTAGEYILQYFAKSIDAQVQRRRLAYKIVEIEIIEERRREFFALEGRSHGDVLPALRALSDAELSKGVA